MYIDRPNKDNVRRSQAKKCMAVKRPAESAAIDNVGAELFAGANNSKRAI